MIGDLAPEDLELLRDAVRNSLGEDAKDHEDLVLQLSTLDLFDMIFELGLVEGNKQTVASTQAKKSSPKKKYRKAPNPRSQEVIVPSVTSPAKCIAQDAHGLDVPETIKPSLVSCARAGAGARAFGKKTKRDVLDLEGPILDPIVRLAWDTGDDDDFEEVVVDTRTLLETEVSRLCQNTQELANSRAEELQKDSSGESPDDPRKEEKRRISSLEADLQKHEAEGAEELSSGQFEALRLHEELELKSELHHKAILHNLTKYEAAEIFRQHGLSEPQEGDFEIVKQLLKESRTSEHAKLRERATGKARVTYRYVNNELVVTKDKEILPVKDVDHIRATTCQLTILGNSSKARREQRLTAEQKKSVSVSKAPKKK